MPGRIADRLADRLADAVGRTRPRHARARRPEPRPHRGGDPHAGGRRRLRARALAGLAVLVAAGLVVSLLVLTGRSHLAAKAQRHPHRHAVSTSPVRVFLGPAGVESSAVVAENRKPGATAWQITGPGAPGFIEGFADRVDAQSGDVVGLYVSTDAPSFEVVAYRMGYYGGSGAREVWTSTTVPGTVQPPCPVTPGVDMVACDNWARSTGVPITPAFVPGDYLLKLVGAGGQQSYLLLTVSNPSSHAAYLLVARSLTEEGWNPYGGFDFYQGTGPCPAGTPSYPVCNRARTVSFDRPYAAGSGPSDFLANEYPLVRFCEEQGLDVTYTTDVTVDEHPELLLGHKAVLSLGHDETWTANERQGAETALAQGVNIAFFGAAAVLRHARLQASALGPDREVVDYRDSAEDPLNGMGDPRQVTGNTFSSPPTSWPETRFVGELYSGYTDPGVAPVPLVVFDASAWIFKGTGLEGGSAVPGVIDSDFDHLDGADVPAGLEVLAHSPLPLADVYTNQGRWGTDTYSDMTYYTDPSSGGGVFDSGTVNWIYALSDCAPESPCPAPLLRQMTANLLWLFGQGPAGAVVPSKANWQTVTPAGS